MSEDLVTRLRSIADSSDHDEECGAYSNGLSMDVDESRCDCSIKDIREGADEIERLRSCSWAVLDMARTVG